MNCILMSICLFLLYLTFSSTLGTSGDALYRELWCACAGPLVNLPLEGERVYYFPQGHMEQVGSAYGCEFVLLEMKFTISFPVHFPYTFVTCCAAMQQRLLFFRFKN